MPWRCSAVWRLRRGNFNAIRRARLELIHLIGQAKRRSWPVDFMHRPCRDRTDEGKTCIDNILNRTGLPAYIRDEEGERPLNF